MAKQLLSQRCQQALAVVQAGGRITHRLERQYSGREQFEYRLWSADGSRVKGFGFHSIYPLVQDGHVSRDYSAIFGSTAQNVFVAKVELAQSA